MLSPFGVARARALRTGAGAQAPATAGGGLTRSLRQMRTWLRVVRALGVGPYLEAVQVRRFSTGTARGYYVTRALTTLLNVGLLDQLARSTWVNIDAYALEHALDARLLRALCDYLYAAHYLTRNGENYALDPERGLSAQALTAPLQLDVRAHEEVFSNLEPLLRQEKTFGAEVTSHAEHADGALTRYFTLPLVADHLRRRGCQVIVDLDCGDASFLIDQCRRNPGLRGYGLDPARDAIEAAQCKVKESRLERRIKLYTGEVFAIGAMADKLQWLDAATCIHTLHHYLPGQRGRVVALFHSFREAYPGTPLIVCEVVRHSPDELRGSRRGVSELQFLHDLSGEGLLTRAEWRELFAEGGFTMIEEEYVSDARTSIFTLS